MRFVFESSASAPNCIITGRGYDDVGPSFTDAIEDFNNIYARYDPFTSQPNPVLARINEFSRANAGRYTVDDEPELDMYTQTLFIDDDVDNSCQMTGDNPYKEIADAITGSGLATVQSSQTIDDSFIEAFGKAFSR